MKTTIIEDTKPKSAYTYPCLLKEQGGTICLATGPVNGVCLFSATNHYPVGFVWPSNGGKHSWDTFPNWTRIEEPATITIRFEP